MALSIDSRETGILSGVDPLEIRKEIPSEYFFAIKMATRL